MQPQCSLHCVICLDLGVKDAVKLQGEVVPYLHNLFSVRMRYVAKRYMKLVERQREREREGERERERESGNWSCLSQEGEADISMQCQCICTWFVASLPIDRVEFLKTP